LTGAQNDRFLGQPELAWRGSNLPVGGTPAELVKPRDGKTNRLILEIS
jgi:hypothetical protein